MIAAIIYSYVQILFNSTVGFYFINGRSPPPSSWRGTLCNGTAELFENTNLTRSIIIIHIGPYTRDQNAYVWHSVLHSAVDLGFRSVEKVVNGF